LLAGGIMSDELSIPNFDTKIRKAPGPDGKRWYVLNDAARTLRYSNPHSLAAKLDPDEKALTVLDTPGGPQRVTIISRPALLKLCGGSEKPEAKEVDRWLRHEVAESVFETGTYTVPGASFADSPLVLSLQAALEIARRQDATDRELGTVKADHRQLAAEVEATRAELAAAKAELVEARAEAERVRRDFTGSAGWFCLVTWAEAKGIRLPPGRDGIEGKLITAMCEAEGIAPRKIPTTRFPKGVNCYPEAMLHRWRWDYLKRHGLSDASSA
jgi:prophage antirepressor-like protein